MPGISWSVESLGAESALEMISIKSSAFQMGSESGDTEEGPLTEVLLRSFALGKTEVTQAQWEALMVGNPSYFCGGDVPVKNVSWMDAMQFCRGLNERDRAAGKLPVGWEYTLLTEAQWEYACRAGSSGDYSGVLREMAWYGENSEAKTHPVGTKKANAWSLHDRHGNVWEWRLDRYQDRLEGIQVTEPVGSSSGSMRVNRGGGWGDHPVYCRTANRSSHPPASRDVKLGFRLALSRVLEGRAQETA